MRREKIVDASRILLRSCITCIQCCPSLYLCFFLYFVPLLLRRISLPKVALWWALTLFRFSILPLFGTFFSNACTSILQKLALSLSYIRYDAMRFDSEVHFRAVALSIPMRSHFSFVSFRLVTFCIRTRTTIYTHILYGHIKYIPSSQFKLVHVL